MERREVGDEMGEIGRDAGDEISVDKADTRNSSDAQAFAKGKEPVQGNFALEIKLVLLYGGIVPEEHDGHEKESEEDGDPSTISEFDEGGR